MGIEELALGNLAQASRYYKEMIALLERAGLHIRCACWPDGVGQSGAGQAELAEASETMFGPQVTSESHVPSFTPSRRLPSWRRSSRPRANGRRRPSCVPPC